jgi:tetratricopeptide (TPR) repeat protein
VKRESGVVLKDLADALRDQGGFDEARKAYQAGLKVNEELKDLRGQGVTLGQLGSLAMREGNVQEAADRHRDALGLFQQLREPAMEAVAWHMLGMVFHESRQWDQAERHYREAGRIEEELGDLARAASTWNQLAAVNREAGKPDAAELWWRKAIEVGRALGDPMGLSRCLGNLAILLQTQPGRLAEARQLAEEALAIMRTLDPGAAEIWRGYGVLATIVDQEAQAAPDARQKAELQEKAREHRRLAREAKRNFAGTRHELRQRLPVILGTIMAVHDSGQRSQLEQMLLGMEQHGWTDLVAAIRRILAGERDPDALYAALDLEDSMIVETILQGLADPSTLSDLLPTDPPPG